MGSSRGASMLVCGVINTRDVVHHHGGVMVIGKESCIAPLLRADNIPQQLCQSWEVASVPVEVAWQPYASVSDLWPPNGNPNCATGIMRLSPATKHEQKIKRRVTQCKRQRCRQSAREVKQRDRHLFVGDDTELDIKA